MSLLMDALKKAEQEKKEAAKRQQESEGFNQLETGKATPKALDDTDTWGHEIVDGSTTAEIPGMGNTGRHSTTGELQLEPITNIDDTAEIPNVNLANASSSVPEDPTLNVTMSEISLADLSNDDIGLDDADTPDDQTHTSIEELQTDSADLLDETFHGVALKGADINPELFQETVRGDAFLPEDLDSSTWGETLPGIPAAQLAKDIGSDDQPTPVAAQTVFTATGTTQSGPGFKWIIGGLGSMALSAFIVWYYITITPMNRTALSPQIAEGVEHVGPPLHETLALNIKPMSGTLSGDVESATDDAEPELVDEDTLLLSTDSSEPPSLDEQDQPPAIVEQKGLDQVGDIASKGSTNTSGTANGIVMAENRGTGIIDSMQESIAAEPSLIKISRSKAPEDKGKGIRDAYFAYQKGAYGTAMEKYQQALKDFPDNRDALLGLGAIASNKGDYQSAYRWYTRVLSINPRDKFATAALLSMQDKSSLSNSESMINSMLHESPDAHFLHFTLGNIYAAGSRWAEAQQAFFDAYRLNSSNADYALNLAISLDHIGQYGAALDYYNAALELSDKTPSKFDPSSVIRRIEDLNKVVER
ncbi:MAG: Flp pilus assembly protein TadD [Gammaproteobacteria bacterium]|jgi:Flp pilus assembly protein TadD